MPITLSISTGAANALWHKLILKTADVNNFFTTLANSTVVILGNTQFLALINTTLTLKIVS